MIPAGSLDLVRIRKAIYDWINTVTQGVLEDNQLQIVWMDQSEAIPPRPFVSLKFTDGPSPIARSANVFLGQAGKPFNAGMQMEATLSVQIYGNIKIHRPIANQLGIDLNSSLLRQSILDDLKSAGVSIQQLGKVRNLSALEETRFEERAGFEIALGMAQNIQDQPSTIRTIQVEADVDGDTFTREIQLP